MRDVLIAAVLTVVLAAIVAYGSRSVVAADMAHQGADQAYADELHEWSETTVELPTPSGTGWPVGPAYSVGAR